MSQAYYSGLFTDVVRSMWYGALVRMVRLRVDTWMRGSASEPLINWKTSLVVSRKALVLMWVLLAVSVLLVETRTIVEA